MLHVKGSGTTSATTSFRVENANASSSMVVLDDGNVGIGTATPTEKLTVNGNTIVGLAAQLGTENAKLKVKAGYEGGAMNGALIEANGATTTLILKHTGNASNSILIDNTNAGTAGMGAGIRINASNNITNFVSFSNSGSTKFLIGGTGDMYVSGSSGGTATFEGTIQSTLNLKAGAQNNYLVGQTNGVLSFRPDGVTAMDINSLGNVSIGTTTPSSRLQVKGSGTTSATTAFRVENANASGSLVVLDNGNVGIGASTPISLLQIGSGSGFLGDFTTPAVTFDNINNGIYLDSNRISFKSGGGFSFAADSNGIIGNGFRINTSIFDDLITPIFVASRLSLGINSGYGGNNAGHLSLITSGSSRIYVDYSGNVGMGTTTPTSKLHVSGSARIDEVLTLTPLDPLPTGSPTGSFAVSASVPPIPYFYDGTTWNALY
jgi:hypothetical protein